MDGGSINLCKHVIVRLSSVRYKHRTGFVQITTTKFPFWNLILISPLILGIREKKILNQQYNSVLVLTPKYLL